MRRFVALVVIVATATFVGSAAAPAADTDPVWLRQLETAGNEENAVSTVVGDGTIVVASSVRDGDGIVFRRLGADGTPLADNEVSITPTPSASHFVGQLASEDYRGYVWAAVHSTSANPAEFVSKLVLLDDELDVVRTIDLTPSSPTTAFLVTGVATTRSGLFATGMGQGTFDGVTTDGVDLVVMSVQGIGGNWSTVFRAPGSAFTFAGAAPGAGGGVAVAWSGGSAQHVAQVGDDGSVAFDAVVSTRPNELLFGLAGNGMHVYAGGYGGVLYQIAAGGQVTQTPLGADKNIYGIATRGADHVVVGGLRFVNPSVSSEYVAYVAELDANGTKVWEDSTDLGDNAAVQDVSAGASVYASGITQFDNDTDDSADAFVAAYTSTVRPSRPTLYPYEGDGSASFEWDPPVDNGGSPLTGYRLGIEPGGLRFDLPATAVYQPVSGLTNGITYTATFTATNAVGESDPAVVQFTPWGAPSVPNNVQVTRGAGNTATVTWNALQPNGRPVSSYQVVVDGTRFVNVGAPATSVVINNINTASHRFRVRAFSEHRASSYSVEVVLPAVVPPTPIVDVFDATFVEGDKKHAETVRVALRAPASQTVTIEYSTKPGTAKRSSDFTAKRAGVVTIAAGQTQTTIPIKIIAGNRPEPTEAFTVTITKVIGAPLGDGSATVTITDDD